MPRITQLNLSEVNRALEHIDQLTKKIGTLQSQLDSVNHQVKNLAVVHAPLTTNNITFTWTGSTLSLSWTAGSIANKNGINTPIPAGSITGLTASTNYWLAWNPTHQKMVANISADVLFQISSNLVICQVFTGSAGTTGVAGGGGSSAGGKSDLSGQRYKLL
jgi:hypothetical protein